MAINTERVQAFIDESTFRIICICNTSHFSHCFCSSPRPSIEYLLKVNVFFCSSLGQLIERFLLSSMLNPGEQWQTKSQHGRALSLEYRLRFRCAYNYFGPLCNKLCRARDDFFGHYICDPSGSKVCMEGWTGPECKEGERMALTCGLVWHVEPYALCTFRTM